MRALMTLRALTAPASLSPGAWLGSYTWCKCLTDTLVSFPLPYLTHTPHRWWLVPKVPGDAGLCHWDHEEANRTPPGKSRSRACSSWS